MCRGLKIRKHFWNESREMNKNELFMNSLKSPIKSLFRKKSSIRIKIYKEKKITQEFWQANFQAIKMNFVSYFNGALLLFFDLKKNIFLWLGIFNLFFRIKKQIQCFGIIFMLRLVDFTSKEFCNRDKIPLLMKLSSNTKKKLNFPSKCFHEKSLKQQKLPVSLITASNHYHVLIKVFCWHSS